jgi:hypothetical protein
MNAQRRATERAVSPAARVFSSLQADDALLPGETSAVRRSGALFLALLVLGAVPLFYAASAAGLIGDLPAAVAKNSSSGPGSGDDDSSGPGPGGDDDDDDDTGTQTRSRTGHGTDDTSANGHSTRGTTNDDDTRTHRGTNDTSANGHSTRGTTDDNDTRTGAGTNTGTRTRTGGR